jgi:hypothetical protein
MSSVRTATSSNQQKTGRRRQKDGAATSGAEISERFLIQVWQRLTGRADLITEEGELIHLIYPGRGNDDRGADLRDAVILSAQGLRKGDIEFHRWSSDWQRHHHHQDPAYNGTVLHVVMWRDTEPVTQLQNEKKVPILALSQHLETAAQRRMRADYPAGAFNLPCYQAAESLPRERIDEMLDAAGQERFRAKAAAFQDELSRDAPDEIFYRGIMGALGYSKNRLPFEELARRVPLHHLETMVRRHQPDEERLARQQALLLGTAGLMPSQRGTLNLLATDDRWVELLERYWCEYKHGQVMSADSWHLVKVRPNNSPVRRIAGISYLVLRYGKVSLLEEIINLISEIEFDQTYWALEAAMTVVAKGYWKTHYDFGGYRRGVAPALIGTSRAAAMAVNVILPFSYAWGSLNAQPELAAKSREIFRTYPKPGTNAIERHMSKQLVRSRVPINSALRQQGLIHIYKTFCTQGKCSICPLGMAVR